MTALPERPVISAPLPWQSSVWSRLTRQIEDKTLPHALLLAGPEYSGKGRLALALVRLLLCRQPVNGLNCGQCHSCELSASGSHGDFCWLEPEEKSRVIKIDQVRKVVEFTNKTASFGLRKVIVIAPADSMNSNAANALLKSLEEPAPDTYLVLVCHRLNRLAATVRSRCQILRLATPDSKNCIDWLDQLTGDRGQSESLWQLAGGRPLLAEQLYRESGIEHLSAVHLALRELFKGKAEVPEISALLADDSIDQVLALIVSELHYVLCRLDARRMASRQGRAAFGLLDDALRTQRAVNAGANPNQQLMVESLLTKYQRELGDNLLGDSIDPSQGEVQL